MKKLALLLIVVFLLTSCFNKTEDTSEVQVIDTNINNQIETPNLDVVDNSNLNVEENIDEEIQKEEEILQSLEEINENEIDELINSIIE